MTTTAKPADPVGDAVTEFIGELLGNAEVELHYTPLDGDCPDVPTAFDGPVIASASAVVVEGWTTTLSVGFGVPTAANVEAVPNALLSLPDAALRAAARFRSFSATNGGGLSPALRRALRDTVIIEMLSHHQGWNNPECASTELLADTLEYLIELSGTRVESHNLTHGVVITDAISHDPRIAVDYPSGLRDAKRSPLLFDGRRSVLIVDEHG